jgi:hypothetical protein
MKRLTPLILASVLMLSLVACGTDIQRNLAPAEQTNTFAENTKDTVYPFDIQKDFFPLYNPTSWKYEIYDQKTNKYITSLTKTLDVNNENSLDLDNKNNYFVVSLKKSYATPGVFKDKEPYEYFRRRDNQLAYDRTDNLAYYPGKTKTSSRSGYDPYQFRPFSNFAANKLETVTVKAGTFQCLKSEFTLGLDSYTIWFAKGVGEVKRIRDTSGFYTYRYELSEFNNSNKQFVLSKEFITISDLPATVKEKASFIKNEYLKINELPADLFDGKPSSSIFVDIRVLRHNRENSYEIVYVNKSLISKDNVNFTVLLANDMTIKNMAAFGENQEKPVYKGKIVDKLPTLN